MKPWKQFELAVANFIAATDPSAKVRPDVRLPDRDTGRLRQRDVWIEATLCKMYRVKILVSCKHMRRKIDEQEMDAFIGELRSSGAQIGILYVKTGYTKPALEKAEAHGISCCKLYEDQPPDLPQCLGLTFYCASSSFSLEGNDAAKRELGNEKIEDVLALTDANNLNIFGLLIDEFWRIQKVKIHESAQKALFPSPWSAQIEIRSDTENSEGMVLSLHGTWRFYRAKREGHLLNGSYNFSSEVFTGSQAFPIIDLHATEPGPDWERLTIPPERMDSCEGLIVLGGGDVRRAILEAHKGKKLNELL